MMQEMLLGAYIRQNREAQGLTQKQLCEGICGPVTISRIENGQQTPSRSRLSALLQRLGLPDDRYFALLSPNEIEISSLQAEIVSCNVHGRRERGLELIAKLESIMEADDHITRQFILRSRVLLGDYGFEEQLDILLEAICLTVPRFDLDKIESFLYSFDEIKIINQIGNAYAEAEQHKKAIDVYSRLLRYVQKHNSNITQSTGQLTLVAYSYALELDACQLYKDAIEIAELCRHACVNYGHYQYLPGALHIMAECYHFTGNDKKSRDLYLQAYGIYKAIGNERDLRLLEKDVREQLGVENWP
ncbi:MAG: transcriptional regulator [Oscillospiraceae bacterium]|nr:transcriptional regulator [Oscillospiraceae bacterium]